jgi:hypothetical protein
MDNIHQSNKVSMSFHGIRFLEISIHINDFVVYFNLLHCDISINENLKRLIKIYFLLSTYFVVLLNMDVMQLISLLILQCVSSLVLLFYVEKILCCNRT